MIVSLIIIVVNLILGAILMLIIKYNLNFLKDKSFFYNYILSFFLIYDKIIIANCVIC